MNRSFAPGVLAALAAALLFGVGTPLAKLLLAHATPWLLAALLYLGSGCGLWLVRRLRGAPAVSLPPAERGWLAAAVLAGGVIAPVLLMTGLSAMPAATAALLLNAEAVFTALLAWFVFRENVDRRIALGMLAIVAGAIVLSWPGERAVEVAALWPACAVVGACFAWGLDNNLTRKVALADASWLAMVKGLAAGLVNLVLALAIGSPFPGGGAMAGAMLVGFLSYGASLVLFVIALRHLGTARTGAYFSISPFFGALAAIAVLDEPVTLALAIGATLMALGVLLHLTEHHEHPHTHQTLNHEHEHTHGIGDPHHDHAHSELVPPGTRHTHRHRHEPITHTHAHFPDAHHRHEH